MQIPVIEIRQGFQSDLRVERHTVPVRRDPMSIVALVDALLAVALEPDVSAETPHLNAFIAE